MKYNVPSKIPLIIPNLCGNESKYLEECVTTNFVSTVGPFVKKFENLIADATRATQAVATCSGTSAIHLALNVVGIEAEDLVIIPSFTFIATANAVKYTGAAPWIFDISNEDWGLCPHLLEETLSKETNISENRCYHTKSGKRVGAIIVVWALGIPSQMDDLIRISKKYHIPIIVDAAGALGSQYKTRYLGELDVACSILSFNGNKIITSGGGGAVVTNSESLAAAVRHLSTTARPTQDYIHDKIGYNYRMTNLEGAVGCAQIENLPKFLKRKQEIVIAYKAIADQFNSVSLFPFREEDLPNHWLCGLLLPSAELTQEVISHLINNGVEARRFWVPIHLQSLYKSCLKTEQKTTESIYQRVLLLPCSTQITQQEIDFVSQTVIEKLSSLKCP